MTRRERLERKLQKRQEWARGRLANSSSSLDAALAVPLPPGGEPIKVGHHSERGHRNALAKADSLMRKSIEHGDMAAHHERKAEGLAEQLGSSIYSDDADAIEQLESRIAEREEERDRRKAANRIIRSAPKGQRTADKDAKLIEVGFAPEILPILFGEGPCGTIGFPAYSLTNIGANIRRDRQRLERIKVAQARAAQAKQAGGVVVVYSPKRTAARVTFAEKPERSVIYALKQAGYHWSNGSWHGPADTLPGCVAIDQP
ncbi:MAG: DUF3560 domain-containing protein [Planctomycetota bacterium]